MYSLAFPSLILRDYRLVEQKSRSPVLKKEGSEGLDLGMILSSVCGLSLGEGTGCVWGRFGIKKGGLCVTGLLLTRGRTLKRIMCVL